MAAVGHDHSALSNQGLQLRRVNAERGIQDEEGTRLVFKWETGCRELRTPARMLVAPSMTAFMPDAQTLLTVVHTVDAGSPAPSAACRAGACVWAIRYDMSPIAVHCGGGTQHAYLLLG